MHGNMYIALRWMDHSIKRIAAFKCTVKLKLERRAVSLVIYAGEKMKDNLLHVSVSSN
jgi:hypothetical protein